MTRPDLFDAAEAMRVAEEMAEDANGFNGHFFFDFERGDIAYVAKECTTHPRSCDCPPKTNHDGDQDCSVPIGGAGGVDECVGEPVARMLNNARSAATQLRAAVARVARMDMHAETYIKIIESHTAARDSLRDQLCAMEADRDRLAAHIATLEAAASATAQWRADAAVRETEALNEARRLRGLAMATLEDIDTRPDYLDEERLARMSARIEAALWTPSKETVDVFRDALETKETP